MSQVQLIEAYARLKSFRSNLPDGYKAEESYFHEHCSIVNLLEQESGFQLDGFRIPDSELQRSVSSIRPANRRRAREVTYTEKRYGDRAILMMKVEALLTFFDIATSASPDKPSIGFRPS